MTRLVPFAAFLLSIACSQQEQASAPANVADAPAPAPVVKAAVPSLEGQWRVTTPAAVDLTIGKGTATLSSGCVRRAFSFTQAGAKVGFASSPAGSANCGSTPSGDTESAAAALADTNLAIFGKDGRTVTLSGIGGMVVLERR